MHRIDTATAESNTNGTGKNGFTNGSPGVTPPTQLDATFFNALQEELANVVEGQALTLTKTNYYQLQTALSCLSGATGPANWTSRTSQFTADHVRAVAYGGGVWVIGGAASKISSSADGGETWTARTSGFGGSDGIQDLVYASALGLFVAVGDNNKIATSPDGVTWTTRTSTFTGTTNTITNVYYVNGVLFAFQGGNSTSQVITSTDGITWTLRTTDATSGSRQWKYVAYSSTLGLYVIAANNANKIQSSSNLSTWTERYTDAVATNFIGVAWGNGTFVAVCANSQHAVSTNGTSWTKYTSANSGSLANVSGGPIVTDLIFDGACFVTVGSAPAGSSHVGFSPTGGLDWQIATCTMTTTARRVIRAGPVGHIAIVADTGQIGTGFYRNQICRRQSRLSTNNLTDIAWGSGAYLGDRLVAVGETASAANSLSF